MTSRTMNEREFDANVVILHHSTTVLPGYQPVLHCGVLRQSAQILSITGTESLKTGESETRLSYPHVIVIIDVSRSVSAFQVRVFSRIHSSRIDISLP